MTTDEALARMRDDWTLSRDEDYDDPDAGLPRWGVWRVIEGEMIDQIGGGATVAEAIIDAETQTLRIEQERAERHADYERRRAAGKLTPLEKAGNFIPTIWAADLIDGFTESPLTRLVNREFESQVKVGDTIRIERG